MCLLLVGLCRKPTEQTLLWVSGFESLAMMMYMQDGHTEKRLKSNGLLHTHAEALVQRPPMRPSTGGTASLLNV